jgi:hypothetical protein
MRVEAHGTVKITLGDGHTVTFDFEDPNTACLESVLTLEMAGNIMDALNALPGFAVIYDAFHSQ